MKTAKNIKKLLNDDSFILWRISGSDELTDYWNEYIGSHPEEEADFKNAIGLFSAIRFNDYRLDAASESGLWSRLMSSVRRKRIRRSIITSSCVAASVAVIALSVILLNRGEEKMLPEAHALFIDTIKGEALPSQNVQFISGNTIVEIAEAEVLEMTSEGTLSIAANNEVIVPQVQVNKLIVPYGKQSSLTLSDGSKMWINSGSEVEFPSHFAGNERSITVKGEIYIEVAKDESRPFFVRSGDMSVRVLGTRFNFSSYDNSGSRYVVLVEGSVEVSSHSHNYLLKPSQMFSVSKSGETGIRSVNVEEYTSWKDGIFVFNQTSLLEVLEKVGRYYNIKFSSNSASQLLNLTCTGRLFLPAEVDPVVNTISVLSGTTYERNDDLIYIYRKKEN